MSLLPAGLRESQPCRYCFYSVVQKWVYAPQGRHIAPINVKFGTGSGAEVCSIVPNFTFIREEMWSYSPKDCQNFEFWPQICPPCRYCFYSVVQKWVYAPQGRHIAPINVKFGTGSGAEVCSIVPNFTFIREEMWSYSPKDCQNFEFWPQICPSWALHLHNFYEILTICTRF